MFHCSPHMSFLLVWSYALLLLETGKRNRWEDSSKFVVYDLIWIKNQLSRRTRLIVFLMRLLRQFCCRHGLAKRTGFQSDEVSHSPRNSSTMTRTSLQKRIRLCSSLQILQLPWARLLFETFQSEEEHENCLLDVPRINKDTKGLLTQTSLYAGIENIQKPQFIWLDSKLCDRLVSQQSKAVQRCVA